jgi:hypothetical protein
MLVAFVGHSRMPQPKVAEANASFLDPGLDWRPHFGLLLDVLFPDPTAFLGGLLVVLLVSIVRSSPDLEAKVSVYVTTIGESEHLPPSRRSAHPSLADTY